MAQKHYFIKTHHGHKTLIVFILLVLLLVGFLLGKSFTTVYITDAAFRVLVVSLLFLMIITMIVSTLMIAHFMIEIKDNLLEVETETDNAVHVQRMRTKSARRKKKKK